MMKYLGFLDKLAVLVLTLCLAGCVVTPAVQADNAVAASQGQPLKFKKKFSDYLQVAIAPDPRKLFTKKSTLTKQQATEFGLNGSLNISLAGKTLAPWAKEPVCTNVIFNAQPINVESFFKHKYGVSMKDLKAAYVLTEYNMNKGATLITVANCPDFYWPSKQFIIMRSIALLESDPAYGAPFIFWHKGVIFSGSAGLGHHPRNR